MTENIDTKIIGYTLLSMGIFVIVFSGMNVYQVFTRQATPINLFNFPGITVGLDQLAGAELPAAQRQQLKESGNSVEIIPADVLNQTSNLIAHLFLMGFIGGVGAKIGKLGVYMIRPIRVILRNEDGKKAKEK